MVLVYGDTNSTLAGALAAALITLVNFFGLFAAFYYFAAAFFNKAEEASLCALSLSLVIYAPTSHYILLPQPSNFSFVFLLFSIGALYRYVMNPSAMYLILGGVLGSLAVNIWWIEWIFHLFDRSSACILHHSPEDLYQDSLILPCSSLRS